MSRIRTVKPEWLEDELLAASSDAARTLSVGLILSADDYGNGRASIATLAASVWRFELERDDGARAAETLAKASGAFRELVDMRFVGCWTEAGQRYYTIRNWTRHQRVDKPGKPLVPSPPRELFEDEKVGEKENSREPRESVASDSRDSREGLPPDRDLDHDLEGRGPVSGARGEVAGKPAAPLTLTPPAGADTPKKARRWTRVPEDWKPKPEHLGIGLPLGIAGQIFDTEVAKFRDYEFAKPRSDADAAFRNWLREAPNRLRTAISARQSRGPVQNSHGKTGTENARRL